MGLPKDESRPLAGAALNVITNDKHNPTACVRCERCSAPLTAAKSVERGLGPVCCKAAA